MTKIVVSCALVALLTSFAGSAVATQPSEAKGRLIDARDLQYASEFAALNYAMAEAVGEDADAAYEDAYAFSLDHSLESALRATDVCPDEPAWAEAIAGGWVGVCGTPQGEFLGYAGEHGVMLPAFYRDLY